MIARTRTWPYILTSCVLVLLVGAVVSTYLRTAPYHFLVVTPGKHYRSGTLESRHLEQVIEQFGIKASTDPDCLALKFLGSLATAHSLTTSTARSRWRLAAGWIAFSVRKPASRPVS